MGKKNDINFQSLSKKEKVTLRNRIFSSIYGYKCKRRFQKLKVFAVASIAIAIFSTLLLSKNSSESSDIEKFADSQNVISSKKDNIELILNNASLTIQDENAQVRYSTDGEKVNINNSKAVTQDNSKLDDSHFNTLVVPFGKRSKIELSDGSKIWLNSGSKLIFPAKFAIEKREVYLEGEAIFEVAHSKNKPFFVKSKDHEIEVLGTVFNVSNYEDDEAIETVLKTGSIKIHYKTEAFLSSKKSVTIKPGIKTSFNKTALTIGEKVVDVDPYFSWRDGIFIFKNDSFTSIMKKLSRYYNISIRIENEDLAKQTFSGYLDVTDNIETVLKTIKETEPLGFEYRFIENKLIIN